MCFSINDLIKNLIKLDEKYDIIALLENDLKRYMELIPRDYLLMKNVKIKYMKEFIPII